jgi:hypothetical protein
MMKYKTHLKKTSLFIAGLFLLISIIVVINTGKWKTGAYVNWDICGYHLYNPAVVIYSDLQKIGFYQQLDSIYHFTPGSYSFQGTTHYESGNAVLKFTCGVALFQLPFFLVAHAWTSLGDTFPADGFSPPYQLAIVLSSILFAFLGLLILRKFLLLYFNEMAVAFSLLIIAFGTNFFLYTSLHPGLSHIYLFFLYSVVLFASQKWHTKPTPKYSIILGLAIGWAVLSRPTDIMLVLIPMLWNTFPAKLRNEKWQLIKHNIPLLLLIAGCVFIPGSLQLFYWKYVTGNWLFYSYPGEGFNFLNSEIWKGLFSFRKGWFIYTPLAFIGITTLFASFSQRRHWFYALPVTVYFVLTIYLVFSWHQWYYGGSFGCRPLLQSLALLGYPLALLFSYLARRSKKLLIPLILISLMGIGLNLYQTWQYHTTVIHWCDMSKDYYWRVFLKPRANAEDTHFLGKDNEN